MEGAAAAAAAAAGGGGEGQGGGDGGGGGGGGGGSSSQLYKCNVLQLLHMLASMRAQVRSGREPAHVVHMVQPLRRRDSKMT